MSTSRRGMQSLLEEAGGRQAPTPSPEFVTRLEAQILADTRPATAVLVPAVARSARVRYVRPVFVAAAAAIAAVVLTGSLAGWFDRNTTQPRLDLASAVDTTVVLPNGNEVEGTNGLDLPDGTVVKTGPDGHASVGPVDLGPSTIAVVEAGRIKITVPEVTLPPVTVPAVPGL